MLGRAVQKLQAATSITTAARGKARGVIVQSYAADVLPYKGKPAEAKSRRVRLEAGKTYHWCSCGLSVKQPFCDGTHKVPGLTNVRPVSFQVSKAPRDVNASRMVAFDESPVYGGVAHKLGYKPKNGGFQ
ncbi:hypothetical protein B9Z55_008804 [Caenorhabditis nigoni]|uniref:Iron-binding zinc finger CDGSH type domain-containing protein n=1 Tax=Caenorhabditis nigoni TaxID=1611254 RepID=A0A2G5UQ33_9PELO|nr:hypothetical protein B9Z55_008804 [Caenorhabditis nigoni]